MAAIHDSPLPVVAFLGLGAMGFAMSTHLLKQGVPVVGFDVWKPTLEKFEKASQSIPDAKASTTTSPAEAAKSAQIILLMVANHHHVNSALFDPEVGAVKTALPNSTIIICSTVPPTHPPEVRKRLDTEFSRPDIRLIDAPVSGGVVGSTSGTLTIMASTSDDPSPLSDPAVHNILSHLSEHGKKLYIIPGSLGSGTSAKALNQVMCGTHIVGASEIMALAAVEGLDTRLFFENIISPDPNPSPSTSEKITTNKRKYGWTWMLENRGPRMLDLSLPIASATSIIHKDVGIIVEEEKRLSITLPQLNRVYEIISTCMSSGLASIDDSQINQYYLGLTSARERKELVATHQKQPSTPMTKAEQETQETLLLAHSLINFASAYETFIFAEALDLLGEEQRRMWFEIIAGAAGGSRVFGEVIPRAFDASPDWRAGFKSYALGIFGGETGVNTRERIEGLIRRVEASGTGVDPVLVKIAWQFTKGLMPSS